MCGGVTKCHLFLLPESKDSFLNSLEVVIHTCDPGTGEAEMGGGVSQIQGPAWLLYQKTLSQTNG